MDSTGQRLPQMRGSKIKISFGRTVAATSAIALIAGMDLFFSVAFGPLVVFGAVFLFTLCLLISNHPRIALIIWLVSIAFIPFWVGVELGAYIAPAAGMAVLVLPVLRKGFSWKLNRIDIAALVLISICSFAGLVGISRIGDVSTVISQWLLGFVVGRLLVQKAGYTFALRLIVFVFSIVGLLAIIEFVFSWNPYMSMYVNNDYFRAFGRLQPRGDIFRAEWAFGHSIALGHALVLALPLAIGLDIKPPLKVIAIVLLCGGVFVSFSRSAQISAVLAIILTVLFVKALPNWQRLALVAGGAISVVVALPVVETVLSNAGPEASHSVDYRRDLLGLIPSMRVMGLANNATEDSSNVVVFSDFGSIDSTFLFLGLRFGVIPALLGIVFCLLLGFAVLRLRASLPMISLVAIMPGIFTASLITQYGMLVWFYVGLCGLALSLSRSPND